MSTRGKRLLAATLTALLLAGCASADKHQSTRASHATAGMNMGGGTSATVNGVKPVAIRTLGTAYWQGMEIQAQTRTPVAFVSVTCPTASCTETMHRPPKGSSFHLMVMLTDRHTHFQIPYASVWATILNSAGKQVWSAQQWPMISEYMGTHYGDNVPYLAPGRYTLRLLISPPQQGRHLEYRHVWLHQHTVVEHFAWRPPAT